jgi:hypothetical protein
VTDLLLVERHRCRYRVNRSHPDPAGVRRRLDGVIAERIPARLADALSAHLPPGDGVVVIRSLGVRVLLGAADPDLLATTDLWTKGLLTAILKALARDDDTVIRYPSRAAYLAAFLAALAAGDAFAHWPFEQFGRWRPLGPAGAATAVCETHSGDVATALAMLAGANDLRRLLALLSAEQAARVGAAAGLRRANPGATPELAALGGDDVVAHALLSGRQFAASPHHLALWLLASLRGSASAAPRLAGGDATSQAVGELAAWGPELAALGLLDTARATGRRAHRLPDEGRRITLLHNAIPALAEALDRAARDDGPAESADGADVLTSAFAGCALLLAGLGAIDLEQALIKVGVAAGATAPLAGRLRWWALLCALGRDHRPVARFDPVLLRLAGDPGGSYGSEMVEQLLDARACATLVESLSAAPVRALQTAAASPSELAHLDISDIVADANIAGVVHALALSAVRDLARRLPGFSTSSAPYIAANLLVGAGRFRFDPAASSASLPDVALRVALQMAGWEDRTVPAPWLPGGALRFDRDDP